MSVQRCNAMVPRLTRFPRSLSRSLPVALIVVAIALAAGSPAAQAQPRGCESLSPNERLLVGCPRESTPAVDCANLDYAARIAARCPDAIYPPDDPALTPTSTATVSGQTPTATETPTTSGFGVPDNDRPDAALVPIDQQPSSGPRDGIRTSTGEQSALPVLAAVAAMSTVGGAGVLAARRQRTVGR